MFCFCWDLFIFCDTHCGPLHVQASAEDVRVLLERNSGLERALLEQQARADQATAALQGMQASWRSFQFQFVAYCGAVDSRLKDLSVLGGTRFVAAMSNIHMDQDMRALSAQMCCMLIVACQEGAQKMLEHESDTEGGVAWRRLLDEYEPRTAGRQCGLLQELLHHGFPRDPRAALDEIEGLLRQCRVAVWSGRQRELEGRTGAERHHGRRPEDPSCVACLTPFELPARTRGSAQRVDHAASPWPMTHAHGHRRSWCEGKSKDKGKAKDKPDAEVTCYYCSTEGHRKADCWSWRKRKRIRRRRRRRRKKKKQRKTCKGTSKDTVRRQCVEICA